MQNNFNGYEMTNAYTKYSEPCSSESQQPLQLNADHYMSRQRTSDQNINNEAILPKKQPEIPHYPLRSTLPSNDIYPISC